ncbi:MAG: hypothetical protein WCR97_03935 [Bacilli bacterium]
MRSKKIVLLFSTLFLSLGILPINNASSTSSCEDGCCCHDEHCSCDHHHEEETVESGLPSRIVFSNNKYNSSDEEGITLTANITPSDTTDKRCVWSVSDTTKVSITPTSEYSSSAVAKAVTKFDGEVTISVYLLSFPSVKFSCKATYVTKLSVTPLVDSLDLNSTDVFSCPNCHTLTYGTKALSELFTLTGSEQGLTYSLDNTNCVIDGTNLKSNIASDSTCTLTAACVEDATITASIPINLTYTKSGNFTTHTYQYSTCSTSYVSGGTSYSYGSWSVDTAATCTSSGSKSRTVTATTTKERYDNDKYVCKFCNSYYWSGKYRYSSGDKTSTSTSTETATIPALGHDWVYYNKVWGGDDDDYTYYLVYVCSRCGMHNTVDYYD